VTELKASQVELTRKVGELSVELVDIRANVKTLEGWVVAMEFTQIPGGSGVPVVPLRTSSFVAPVSVGGAISVSGAGLMPDMTSADIDRLLGMDGGSAPMF